MNKKVLLRPIVLFCMMIFSFFASAQTTSSTTYDNEQRYSWLPFTSHGYVGGSIGQATYDDLTCVGGSSCDDEDIGFKIFTGGRIKNILGIELGYINLGEVDVNGGSAKAQGIDLSVVGNLPIGSSQFSVFGKIGTTYGWTKTNPGAQAAVLGAPSGKERGFGWNYGVGVNYDLNRNWAIRGEWERRRFEFVDNDKDIDLLSVGFNYKF